MLGFKTSLTGKLPVDIEAGYDGTTLTVEAGNFSKDLTTLTQERFNNLNVVLPKESGGISVVKVRGSISKSGKDRIIDLSGEMSAIQNPLPFLQDISIDKALFHYHYKSIAPVGKNAADLSGQSILIGCRTSITGELAKAMPKAKFTGAYFLSDNASIVYFDFSGEIKVGELIRLIFGVKPTNLELDVKTAGVFQVSKKDTTSIKGHGKEKDRIDPGVPYSEALNQIVELKNNQTAPNASTGELMPKSFPITQAGSDFSIQFNEAFKGDGVTGLCFWGEINFSKIELFDSLLTIGYSKKQVNQLILYGFKTQTKTTPSNNDKDKDKDQTPPTNSAFFVQLPRITLLNILAFGGNKGREGILFQYSSNKEEYELSGTVEFDPFKGIHKDKDENQAEDKKQDPAFLFDGDLVVNKENLRGTLAVSIGSESKEINQPLGMKGAKLAELYLSIDRTFAQPDAKPTPIKKHTDITIGGYFNHQFRNSSTKIRFEGDIVFESTEKGTDARLVVFSMNSNPALTLNDFVGEIIESPWKWTDVVTRQFAFISGDMYFLKCPKSDSDHDDDKNKNECKGFSFDYISPRALEQSRLNGEKAPTAVTYYPGYHIDAKLSIFESYVFEIKLAVEKKGIELSGEYVGTYDCEGKDCKVIPNSNVKVFFIELQSPKLAISTIDGTKFQLSVEKVKLFGTDIGKLTANYQRGKKDREKRMFSGNYKHPSSDLSIDWQWTKGSFDITHIKGLGSQSFDAAKELTTALNKFKKGRDEISRLMGGMGKKKCEKIVKNALNGMFKSHLTLSLHGMPKDRGLDHNNHHKMLVPLLIKYTLKAGDTALTGKSPIEIPFDAEFTIPTSVSDLPGAIWSTVTDPENLENIASDILQDKGTYQALAVVLAKKGAASAAARMLCRAAEDEAEELAKKLAKELTDKLKAEVGQMLELSGQVVAVMSGTAKKIVSGFFHALEDLLKKIFGNDDDDKAQAIKDGKANLKLINDSIVPVITNVTNTLEAVKLAIEVQALRVGIDGNNAYNAHWDLATDNKLGLNNSNLEYQLQFLKGKPKNPNDKKSDEKNQFLEPGLSKLNKLPGFELMTEKPFSKSWASMLKDAPGYQMNASIQTRITGYTFITTETEDALKKAVEQIQKLKSHIPEAEETADKIKNFSSDMHDYQNLGLFSKIVYAELENPNFTVGESLLGINTTIK